MTPIVFFLHRRSHWSFAECREAFGCDLDRWIYFGDYPGAAPPLEEFFLTDPATLFG